MSYDVIFGFSKQKWARRPRLPMSTGTLDFGFSDFGFLDFGLWILDFGFWISGFGFWILDMGLGPQACVFGRVRSSQGRFFPPKK